MSERKPRLQGSRAEDKPRKPFVEPRVSAPRDVLEATTNFLQSAGVVSSTSTT